MTLELDTEFMQVEQFAEKLATRLLVRRGNKLKGFYTATWVDKENQVLEHTGSEIILAGVHRGGPLKLYLQKPLDS